MPSMVKMARVAFAVSISEVRLGVKEVATILLRPSLGKCIRWYTAFMRDEYQTRFHEALGALNEDQRWAVEAIEGPVMVIAGPGTGKTQVLTLRIANILYRTDMRPENILALTFTDSGAKAMRERLRHYLGPLAYRVPIFTFHGFAQRLIAEYPEAFPRIIGGRPATDIEKIELLETILEDRSFTQLRPIGNTTFYVPSLLSMISELKRSYVSPTELNSLITTQEEQLATIERVHQKGAHKGKVRGEYSTLEKQIAKNRELQAVYVRYEAALAAARVYDFDDMIIETVAALDREEDMLRDLQETYQYVLADEHQDVNAAQNKILERLCDFHERPNIFVVGDEKQAIYRFQGASIENFLYFTTVYKEVTVIKLEQNYRSSQGILDLAHEVITVPDSELMAMRTPLLAATSDSGQYSWRTFSHQAVEDDWLVSEIKEQLASGVAPSEIAIIVRTNEEVENFAVRLRQAGIPVTASAEGDVLDHPILQAVEQLIQAVVDGTDEAGLATVLQASYWGLPLADIVRILTARSLQTPLSSLLADPEKLTALGVTEIDRATRIIQILEEARAREVHEPPHRVLEYLLDASGFLNHVMSHDPFDGARVIRRIYDEIESIVVRDGVVTLAAVRRLISLRRGYRLPLHAPYIATTSAAVQVMTAHKAKGLEFLVVFVPHLIDSQWGGKVRRRMFVVPLARFIDEEDVDPLDDERRLFYVACTRAKRTLYLSAATHSPQGRDLVISRLVTGLLDQGVLAAEDVSRFEADFSPVAALTGTGGIDQAATLEVLTHLLKTRGLSATSLNNLLRNPWDFVFRNLLRVPETQSLHLQFGTALHGVLESATRQRTQTGAWPTDGELLEWLKKELRRLPISNSEFALLHEKGAAMLVIYVEHLRRTVFVPTREELSLRATLPLGLSDLPEITLTGKIDRCDLSAEGQVLRVVDYKTGKPKTRGVIMGETKDSDGDYLRQLTFYVLLLSLQDDERLRTKTAVLSFVEPTVKGEVKEELFEITPEEVAELARTTEDAIARFLRGDFLSDVASRDASGYPVLARYWQERFKSI